MEKKLRKSNDKMIAGVCSGLAEYFGFDTDIVRIMFVIFGIFSGATIIIYIVLLFMIPDALPFNNNNPHNNDFY